MSRGIKLDDIYLRMLDELERDARISNAELAKRLNISETAVRRRLNLLLDEGYVRMGVIADPVKFGFQLQIWAGLRVAPGSIHDAAKQLNQRPEVTYVAIVAGNYDVVLAAWFESAAELQTFLSDHLRRVEGVLHCDTYLVLEVLAGIRGTLRPSVNPPGWHRRRRPGRTSRG